MSLKSLIENEYLKQTEDFVASVLFRALENGAAPSKIYDDFVINVCRTHLKSPQILAFLYSVAPPGIAARNLKNNMLEELGLDKSGVSHPQLLHKIAAAAGFDEAVRAELDKLAQDDVRRTISEPILFGTLKEIGLSVLIETTAFEWMLSRTATRLSDFLFTRRGLSRQSLEWFRLHSEVDVQHAEEGLETIVDYINFYEMDKMDVDAILDVTFRQNVFIKRYFGEITLARSADARLKQMRIVGGKIYRLRIPFIESFAHSTKTRSFSDSFVVQLIDKTGVTGYGEGLARPYVTGETVESSIAHIKTRLFPRISGRNFPFIDVNDDPLATLSCLTKELPADDDSKTVIWNAALAAVEIALIDCYLKTQKLSLAQLLPPSREFVVYSGVIPTGTIEKAVQYAKRFKLFGVNQLKIKIDGNQDVERVRSVRELLGQTASLRVDANGAYTVSEAIDVLIKLAPFNIEAVEQPIPRGEVGDLVIVKENSPIPIMVDESLITLDDARKLIKARACDYFNLRLSKCGGISRIIKLARLAAQAGIKIQLGCQVGETAILSAAGRHVAAYLDSPKFVEGSYGNLLLAEDVSRNPINFGHRGRAPILRGLGTGVQVRDEILEKYACSTTIFRKYKEYAETT